MVINTLTATQCREVLERTSLGKLACARDDQPYVVPVFLYFSQDEDCLYSFSSQGRKIDWMRTNPKVCVEIDEVESQYHWTTVVVFGRYEELADEPNRESIRRAYTLFRPRPDWWLPGAARPAHDARGYAPVVYRVRIESLTGRRASRPHRP